MEEHFLWLFYLKVWFFLKEILLHFSEVFTFACGSILDPTNTRKYNSIRTKKSGGK